MTAADATPVAADDLGVRSLPLLPTTVLTHTQAPVCPRCGAGQSTNYGARCSCRSCGNNWQAQ